MTTWLGKIIYADILNLLQVMRDDDAIRWCDKGGEEGGTGTPPPPPPPPPPRTRILTK